MNEREKIMRNTKAKRAKAFFESRDMIYVSCKKCDNGYYIIGKKEDGIFIRYHVDFTDCNMLILDYVPGVIEFTPINEPAVTLDIVNF